MRSLYGKASASPKKINAHMLWKSGQSFDAMSEELRVATATAEVYVIDILAQGRAEDTDCRKILLDLKVSKPAFYAIKCQMTKPGCSLREIRDETGLTYNQIRAVLASLINGFEL